MRTKQTFLQELIIPFVIVVLFLAIGQADFLQESPAIDMVPENGNHTQILFYNNKYLKEKKTAASHTYVSDPKTFVESNMICATHCENKILWSEKKEIIISEAYID